MARPLHKREPFAWLSSCSSKKQCLWTLLFLCANTRYDFFVGLLNYKLSEHKKRRRIGVRIRCPTREVTVVAEHLAELDSQNPYEAPLEPQSGTTSAPRNHRDSSTWAIVRDCLLLVFCIAISGSIFGMGLGTLAVGTDGLLGGGILGLILAIIPSIVMVCLCRAVVPPFLRAYPGWIAHYAVGLASGGLTGFVAVLFLSSAELDMPVLLLALTAALLGGLGGFLGSHLSSRWHWESWEES